MRRGIVGTNVLMDWVLVMTNRTKVPGNYCQWEGNLGVGWEYVWGPIRTCISLCACVYMFEYVHM